MKAMTTGEIAIELGSGVVDCKGSLGALIATC